MTLQCFSRKDCGEVDAPQKYRVVDSVGNVILVDGASCYATGDIVSIRNEMRQSIAAFYKPISVTPQDG